MNTQNYEKNFVSYCEVVRAGRKAREFEFIVKDFESIVERLMHLLPSNCLPSNLKVLHSELWSLQLKARNQYDCLFEKHVSKLKGQ